MKPGVRFCSQWMNRGRVHGHYVENRIKIAEKRTRGRGIYVRNAAILVFVDWINFSAVTECLAAF
jgi:hypothetical protein